MKLFINGQEVQPINKFKLRSVKTYGQIKQIMDKKAQEQLRE